MREVPQYLQSHLCKSPTTAPTMSSHTNLNIKERISRFSDPHNGGVSVRLPPKPQFQFVQDNQVCYTLELSSDLKMPDYKMLVI